MRISDWSSDVCSSDLVVRSDEAHIPSKNNYQGEGSAPPPLSYFAAGAAFCLMSHLKGYIHERKLDVRSYAVEQRLKFTRGLPEDVENSGKPGASCDLLETHVIIDSDEEIGRASCRERVCQYV